MAEFNMRSDAVDVEQIMRQIRARIREKRGVDYTEEEIRQLASVKLEKFLEPTGVRSDLVEQFRRRQPDTTPPLNYGFEDDTIYESHRAPLRRIRRLLNPLLKLFFNPNPISHVLHMQAEINQRLYTRNQTREPLYFEVMHNLVLEMTRLGIEVKNLKMRVESLSSRLDFDEHRARALEGVVQYKPRAAAGPASPERPPAGDERAPEPETARAGGEAEGAEERRRRRRRRRRRGGRQAGESTGAAAGPGPGGEPTLGEADAGRPDDHESTEPAGSAAPDARADDHRPEPGAAAEPTGGPDPENP